MTDTAAAAGAGVPATGPQWVVFTCDGRRYVVPLDRVREILTPQPRTRMPGCGPEVAGLIGVRGRVVTVLDLGVLLAARPSVERTDHRILLVEQGARVVGAAVDEVLAVSHATTAPYVRGDAGPDAQRLEPRDVIGAGTIDGKPFVALNIDAILGRILA